MTKKSKLLLVLVVILGVGKFSGHAISAQAAPKKIEITAKRYHYDPQEITLTKGEPVTFVIKSLDVTHGMRLKELNIDATIPKGETTEVKVTPDTVGEFTAQCSVFCGNDHGTMALTIHVVEKQ